MCLEIIYFIYLYKKDLTLNKLQWLICHKTKPNQTKPDSIDRLNDGGSCLDDATHTRWKWELDVLWTPIKDDRFLYSLSLSGWNTRRQAFVRTESEWTF